MFKNNMFIEYNNVQYKGISFIVFKLNELKRSADTIRKQQKLLFFLKKKNVKSTQCTTLGTCGYP